MIGRTWAVYLYNKIYMFISSLWRENMIFINILFWAYFEKFCWIQYLSNECGIWLILFVFIICKSLTVETKRFVHIDDLQNHNLVFWTWILVGRLVFELFYLTRNAAPAALKKSLILYLMWTFVNIVSARVVEFGYYVALDQSQTSIWFKEFEIIVLESNFMNFWHRDLPNMSKAPEYENE